MSALQPLLSEQLRPQTLTDLILPDDVQRSFARMIASKSLMNMVLYGAPGIGKTSAARVLLRDVDASKFVLNGSLSDGDKTMVRRIESFASTVALCGRPRVCLIDEADHLSKEAQGALRYVIENTSKSARFIMTANDIAKLSSAIKSRCTPICFDVPRSQAMTVIDRLVSFYSYRLAALGYEANDHRLAQIVSAYFPDLRQIANVCEREFST